MIDLSWELLYGLGALFIALAIAYGLMRNRGRNKANDAITEQATREEYQHPERYERTEDEFRERVRPS
ncbi:MAG TPA: hypothetical protein PKA17_03625 [Phenylobacterium sp.]|jgi:hypothetical protein|nr:hypothetical protein [Phenylobacterium sp.]